MDSRRCEVYSEDSSGSSMKKSLVLFLVATLLLAGCTELLDSGDGETKKIEINEDIAFEKINDFMTVDEGESFGITMMYEMDSSMLAESGLMDSDEESNAVITMEMTEAWSPAGYHTSEIMGMSNEGITYKMVETITHIDTTMYVTIGYDATGTLPSDATDEEKMQFEMISQQGIESYSMTTSNSHTDVIASMAEDTQNDGDGMDMMEMLEVFTFTECMGVFTPSTETVDGLQIFDVTMEDMEDSMTPNMALCLFDTDNSDSISFEEFTASDDTEEGDVDEMRTVFDNADANANGELDSTELVTFIESMDSLEGEEDHMHDDEDEHMHDEDESGEMPDMSVAFNNAGEIEYFGMSMDGTEMQMYVLTEDKVSAFFTGAEAGELVALPFSISDSMDDDWDDVMDGGEDEDTTDGSDNGGDNGEDQDSEDDGPSPQDLLDMTDTDDSGLMDFDEFITFMSESDETGSGPGESMPQSVIDEFEQIFNISDLDESGDLDHNELEQFILDLTDYLDDDSGSDDEEVSGCTDMTAINYDAGATDDDGSCYYDDVDDWMMWTFNRDMSECDSDNDGMVNSTEFDDCVIMDLINDGYDSDSYALDNAQMLFDMVDTDEDGMLDSDEFATFAAMTSGEPMMVCYNMDTHEIDMSINSEADCDAAGLMWTESDSGSDDSEEDEFMCDDGSTIPMNYVNDGDEDCDGGEDEDDMGGSDHDHGDSDANTFYIETSQDVMIPFEGDMSDYKIELTTCRDDYNPDTMGYDTTCGESVMSIAISDAGENSDIMFHDTDNSGTISVGDMIHIGETTGEWNTVRLYSISADAYSDENPIYNTPGFTGLVGMLALLGAAFIRRND